MKNLEKINNIYTDYKSVVNERLGYNWFKDGKDLDKRFPNLNIKRSERAFEVVEVKDYKKSFIYVLSNVKTDTEEKYKLLILKEEFQGGFDQYILNKEQFDKINKIFKVLNVQVIKYFLNKNDLSFLNFNVFEIKRYNLVNWDKGEL